MTQSSSDPWSSPLDILLHERYGGAVNIRGVRYQILYSVLRAFDLFGTSDPHAVIRLEGIEDLDLLGLDTGDEYIQVKSAQDPWNWAKLKEPVGSFLEAHRRDHTLPLRLVFNFVPRSDIKKLAEFESLHSRERKQVKKKFRELCKNLYSKDEVAKGKSNATTREADNLLSHLSITSVSEADILSDLQTATMRFDMTSSTAQIYIHVLVSKFLHWAENRESISARQLESIRLGLEEELSREQAFLQGYGKALIDKLDWSVDASPNDFFDAKATRSGHIVAGLAIPRPKWLAKIHEALTKSRVCVIRSSSGQGKSALLFSYAYERWSSSTVLVLRVAETHEQVEQVIQYLRRRASLVLQ